MVLGGMTHTVFLGIQHLSLIPNPKEGRMILDEIKQASLAARKAQDRATVEALSVVLSEIQTREKDKSNNQIDDDVVTSILKKQIQSSLDLKNSKSSIGRDTSEEDAAIALYQSFLPKELSREELEAEVTAIFGDRRDIKLMKEASAALKEKGLTFDNKTLSNILRGVSD